MVLGAEVCPDMPRNWSKVVPETEQHKVNSGKAGGGRADRAKGNSVKCCGETGYKSGRCPDQVCGVCGGKLL